MLDQYSTSFTKKIKKNSCEGNKSLNSSELFTPDLVDGTTVKKLKHTTYDKKQICSIFAEKNEESGAVVVPGTRSRFQFSGFC